MRLKISLFTLFLLEVLIFLVFSPVNSNLQAQPASILPSDDVYVYSGSGHDQNFNHVQSIILDDASDILMGYIKFNFTNIDSIETATLNLTKEYITYGTTSPNVNIHIITGENWFEENITWDSKPIMAGINITFPVTYDDEYWEIDITSIVQDWQTGRIHNYGLVLEAQGEGITLEFYSKETTEEDPAKKPHILLTYLPVEQEFSKKIFPVILLTIVIFSSAIITFRKNY